MSVMMIIATLILGIVMLIFGSVIKNKWLKMLSVIPLAIFLYQLVRFLGFLLF